MKTKTTTHKINPFIELAKNNTMHGVKTTFGKKEHKTYHVISSEMESGNETEDTITFAKKQIIDKDQFIKVYCAGFKTLSELKNSTKLVFTYVFEKIRSEVGKDNYYFSFRDYSEYCQTEKINPLSETTYWRGMKELIEKEVLAKSHLENLYFINIAYVFNGDRLKFIQEYELKKTTKTTQNNE